MGMQSNWVNCQWGLYCRQVQGQMKFIANKVQTLGKDLRIDRDRINVAVKK